MKFGFSVMVDVVEQADLQLIADALSALPVEQVRNIQLSTAYALPEATDAVLADQS